jgi:hypothetical protein
MRAHRLAPPDPGFARRLSALSQAADIEAGVCAEAHELGLAWRPMPGAERAEPPYELRPGTGRRGPAELWEQFDAAVAHFNHATARTDSAAVAAAYREISTSARALADALEPEDRDTAREAKRRAGAA